MRPRLNDAGLLCMQAVGRRALSWLRVIPDWMPWLVDLNMTTSFEDTLLFFFTFKSGSVPKRRPSPLPEHNLFRHCLPPRLKNNICDAGFEDITGVIGVKMYTAFHTLFAYENHDLPHVPCTYNGLWEWQMFVNCFCFKKSTPRTRRHQSRQGSVSRQA